MQPNYYLDVSKVAEVLRNFSKYRKKPGKKGRGKTWPGLKHFEQADIDRIAIRLLSTSWGGRKATKSLMEMADAIEALLLYLRCLILNSRYELKFVNTSDCMMT